MNSFNKVDYKTAEENYDELYAIAITMTRRELRAELANRVAMPGWAVRAYETALREKYPSQKDYEAHEGGAQ